MLIFESHFPADKFIFPPTETLGAAAVTTAFGFPIDTLGPPILTSAFTDYGASILTLGTFTLRLGAFTLRSALGAFKFILTSGTLTLADSSTLGA